MLRLGSLSPETVLHVGILCLPTDAHSLRVNKHFPPPPPFAPIEIVRRVPWCGSGVATKRARRVKLPSFLA